MVFGLKSGKGRDTGLARAGRAVCEGMVARIEPLEERRLLAAPILDSIGNVDVPGGKWLLVPLSASDADGDALTYQARSHAPKNVKVRLLTNITYLKMTFSIAASGSNPAGTGEMVFALFGDLTPNTVDVITGLVNAEFYNGKTIHRVANLAPTGTVQNPIPPVHIVQGGSGSTPTSFQYPDEWSRMAIFTGQGQLALAKPTGDDNNSTQFFVTQGPVRHLDFNHTVFGQLVSQTSNLVGNHYKTMLQQIIDVPRDANSDAPSQTITITKAQIIEDPEQFGVMAIWAGKKRVSGRVTVTVRDGTGERDFRTFRVRSVRDTVNQQPILEPIGNRVAPMDKPVMIRLKHWDAEGDPVIFGTDPVVNGYARIEGNLLTVWPNPGYQGPVTIKIRVQQYDRTTRSTRIDFSRAYDEETFTIAFGDVPPAAEVPALPISAVAGTPAANVVVGTFMDADPESEPENFSALINWGDGQVTSGIISKDNEIFTIKGTNTYRSEGVFRVTVTVTGKYGAKTKITTTAEVADAPLTGTPTEVLAYPGEVLIDEVVATFIDGDPFGEVSDFTGIINWGDNSSSAALIRKSGNKFEVLGSHTYALAGEYPIEVKINDKGGSSVTINSTAYIARSSLAVSLGPTTSISEGGTFTREATFTDDDPTVESWTVKVDYGDGTGYHDVEPTPDKKIPLTRLYQDNGTYRIRVIVTDSNGGTGSAEMVLTVNNVAPVSSATAERVRGVRNQPLTFNLAAIDPSSKDTEHGFSYRIDWADGAGGTSNYQTLPTGSKTVIHAFKKAGTYVIKIQATDKDGGISIEQLMTITIVDAELQTSLTIPGAMDLVIGGTNIDTATGHNGNDNILIERLEDNSIRAVMNGVSLGIFNPSGHIVVFAGEGDDTVTPSANVAHVLELYGGPGNDKLIGATRDDILVGGSGDDTLIGNGGNDLLIGGYGSDFLDGGDGDDLLIAPATAHDNAPAALAAIMKEWTSNQPYSSRRDHLLQAPAGLNQNSEGVGVFLNKTTIFDDSNIDTLKGGGGEDLYFGSSVFYSWFAKDIFLDRAGTETLVDLSSQ